MLIIHITVMIVITGHRMGGCAEEILVCACRFDVKVYGDGVVFVEYDCDVEELFAGR